MGKPPIKLTFVKVEILLFYIWRHLHHHEHSFEEINI